MRLSPCSTVCGDTGEGKPEEVADAIRCYGIDPEAPDPRSMWASGGQEPGVGPLWCAGSVVGRCLCGGYRPTGDQQLNRSDVVFGDRRGHGDRADPSPS